MAVYFRKVADSRWGRITGLALTFVILSLMTIVQIRHHQIIGYDDFIYHMSRIEAFSESIRAHQWFNFRNFVTFNQIGVANNYFYPYVYDWLWGLIFVLVGNPVWSYYIGLFIIMLAGLMVTYTSVWSLSKSRLVAFLVAIFYMTTPYHVFIMTGASVLGETLAATFVPLYVLGARELLRGPLNRWWIIAVALALTAYAHLITLAFEIGLLLVLYLWSLVKDQQRLKRFVSCLKAAGLFMALTSFFWVPFIQLLLRAPVQATIPLQHVMFLNDFGGLVNAMLTNGSINGIIVNPGIMALIATTLIVVFGRLLSFDGKVVATIGIGLLLVSTSLFPWYLLPNGIQNAIQFPYRLYDITSFCLILSGVQIVEQLLKRRGEGETKSNLRLCTLLVLTGTCFLLYGSLVSTNNRIKADNTPYTSLAAPKLKEAFNVHFRLDTANYNALFKAPRQFFGTVDYAPRPAWTEQHQQSLITHRVLVGGKTITSRYVSKPDRITYQFKLKRAGQVDVPVLHYGTERVLVNGSRVQATMSERGGTLISAKAGRNTVVISEPRPWLFAPLLGLSGLAWLALLLKLINKYFRLKRD